MTQTTPSKENCTDCQRVGKPQDDQQQNSGVTYNEGTGIKDKVIISGPLSEVLAKQLAVVFHKKDLTLDADPQEADVPAAATETYAQDQAVVQAFQAAANKPDNQVILGNFDVLSVKDHMQRMLSEQPNAQDVQASAEIPVVVMSENDLLDTALLNEVQLKGSDELLVLHAPDPFTGKSEDTFAVRSEANPVLQVLHNGEYTPPAQDPDAPTVAEKAAAIERLYSGQVKRIHFGLEAFIASLAERMSNRA